MVRVTGPSLETLYAYLNEQVGTRAPASHNHAQSEVTGLASALDGKAPTAHTHAQSQIANLEYELSRRVNKAALTVPNGSALKTAVDSGTYRLLSNHPDLPPNAGDGQMFVSRGGDTIAQIVIPWSSRRFYYRSGNPPEVGGAGNISDWVRLYQEGEGVLARKLSKYITIAPGDGWTYAGGQDKYYHQYAFDGAKQGMKVYVDTNTVCGAGFPLISVCALNGLIEVAMADVPTTSAYVLIDLFEVI